MQVTEWVSKAPSEINQAVIQNSLAYCGVVQRGDNFKDHLHVELKKQLQINVTDEIVLDSSSDDESILAISDKGKVLCSVNLNTT